MNIELLEIGTPPPDEHCGCAICAIGRIQTDSLSEQLKNQRAREFGHALLKACSSLAAIEQSDFVNTISILEKMGYPVTAQFVHEVQRLHIAINELATKFHEENVSHRPESLVN